MGIRGDFSRLDDLAQRIEAIAKPPSWRDLNQQLAHEALAQVQQEFERSESPYGEPWKTSTQHGQPRYGGQILRDTNRLMNAFRASWNDHGFVVSNGVVYAAIHNLGGTITHGPRTNAHLRSGRFARKSSLADRARAVRVSFSEARSFQMPKRQFFPDAPRGLGDWRDPLLEIARLWLHEGLGVPA